MMKGRQLRWFYYCVSALMLAVSCTSLHDLDNASSAYGKDAENSAGGGSPGNVPTSGGGQVDASTGGRVDSGTGGRSVAGSDAGVAGHAGEAGDAGGDLPDGGVCPPECTGGCSGGTCRIIGTADSLIICPEGMPCLVTCDAERACNQVLCGDATSCRVQCLDNGTCAGLVQCGAGPCTVTCAGSSSCRAVICGNSSDCHVMCTGAASCFNEVTCGSGRCEVDCSSVNSCSVKVRCSNSCYCDVECATRSACYGSSIIVECAANCSAAGGCDPTLPNCVSSTCP